jgi:hypothetical protein
MALNPAILVGAGALALLMFAGKKGGKKTADDSKSDALKPSGKKQKPVTPDPGGVDPKKPTTPPGLETIVALLEDYRLPEGYELPKLSDDEWRGYLWIADDCGAWALGKDFKRQKFEPMLTSFYQSTIDRMLESDPELAASDPNEWVRVQLVDRGETEVVETPTRQAVKQLIATMYGNKYANCTEMMPGAESMSGADEYLAAWQDFMTAHPNLYALYYTLYKYSQEILDRLWQERFPEEYERAFEREWARKAVKENAGRGVDENGITDWAYHNAYPDCVAIIDPQNPEHEDCRLAWLRLRDYVREEMG